MLLDVASASHVIAAATPVALDYGALVTKAIGGGASGALAGVVQVSSLMWLRTAMNYQYANGGNGTLSTVATLYEEGGLPRLYRGVQYALVQNPLSRFGDAAANAIDRARGGGAQGRGAGTAHQGQGGEQQDEDAFGHDPVSVDKAASVARPAGPRLERSCVTWP